MHILQAPTLVYLLCTLTSILCLLLLVRGYMQSKVRLLLWSALCFVGLAFNNFFVLLDLVILPDVYLTPLRHASTLMALTVLLYGFIFEVD